MITDQSDQHYNKFLKKRTVNFDRLPMRECVVFRYTMQGAIIMLFAVANGTDVEIWVNGLETTMLKILLDDAYM